MTSFKSFEDLDCWKACRDVVHFVRTITKKFPSHEKYDLVDNMRRAARSSSRNLAEGFGRFSYQEKIKYSIITRGSLFEVIDDLITSKEEKYIDETEYNTGRQLIDRAIGLTNGYIKYLEKAKAESGYKVSEGEIEYPADPYNI